MFHKILIPVDGSDKSLEALDVGADIALHFDAEVYLLSVFKHYSFMEASLSMVRGKTEPENLEDVLRQYSQKIVAKGKKRLEKKGVEKIRGFVKMGAAAKEILKFQKEHGIDLIVIGSQGQGDLTGYLLGGVSHKVTGLAKCPVMVV
jgi:nucleotide-binding universal stress UspA family protein